MEQYLKNFKNCLQKEIPYCVAECPFHVDILDFIEKIKRGGFNAAFKTYRNAVGFPMVASALCHEPCKTVCPGKSGVSAIELGKLEAACISFSDDTNPTSYNLPQKNKKVAVIGAGISGLSCALRLCMKKYEVEIFEETERIGGNLWELLPPEIFLKDIERQFKHEKYALHLNTEIKRVEDIEAEGFDAVYVATGIGGSDFGLLSKTDKNEDKYCAQYKDAGWFAGGGLIGDKPIYALANGLFMGTTIDNYLKTGNIIYPDNVQKTKMCLNPSKIKFQEPVTPSDGLAFNREEAKLEASRCIECKCDFCRTYCDLTDFYNKWPLRIRDEVMATTLPGAADIKATPAKRLISTCNQCGLCKETCPEEIDIGGLILEGRKSMHSQNKAPWAFYDFWLRDMDFANGEAAEISKASKQEGKYLNRVDQSMRQLEEPNNYAFFPGCQLGASDPELVEKTYDYLLSKREDTGLLVRCCGAPAEWSGDEEKHKAEIAENYRLWESIGKPILILACPTCEKKFKTYMQDIPVISLYEIIDDWGIETLAPAESGKYGGKVYSVFDPCAARQEQGMKKAVRTLAKSAGFDLEPLPENDDFARCCSFGGQPAIANPEYAEFVTQKRIKESENPYITYCINCRDIFAAAGKETVHILNAIFGESVDNKGIVTISARRNNRVELKNRLLKRFWNEEIKETKKKNNIKAYIFPELAEKLNSDRILEEDVISVIEFCEHTGRKVYHFEEDTYSGYMEIGFMTYWVEYRVTPEKDAFELVNAYAHRMKIELETVWNGKKIISY